MRTIDELYDAIMALPIEERTSLIDRLLDVEDFLNNQEWRAEIKRRVAAVKSGEVGTTSWDDVQAVLRQRYG